MCNAKLHLGKGQTFAVFQRPILIFDCFMKNKHALTLFWWKEIWSGGQDFHEVKPSFWNRRAKGYSLQPSCDTPVSACTLGSWATPTKGRCLQRLRLPAQLACSEALPSWATARCPTRFCRKGKANLCVSHHSSTLNVKSRQQIHSVNIIKEQATTWPAHTFL